MRIVGGALKGRALVAPEGLGTRPTSDRARQAIFNVLEHASWSPGLRGARVLDLFAGTGALGLEAISRGAVHALFVERDRQAQAALRANIDTLGVGGAAKVSPRDATKLGPRPNASEPAFDLVFLDPPYAQGLGEAALEAVRTEGWLSPHGCVVWECARDETGAAPDSFSEIDRRSYGAAQVVFLKLAGQP